MIHFLRLILIAAALAYAGICAFLFFFQRSIIYFPQPSEASNKIRLPIPDAQVLVTTRELDNSPRAVLYFGGNAEDVSLNLPDLSDAFPGSALYLMHYRGYGGSSGKPSEKVLFADALTLFDEVHKRHSEITVIGRSLGSGVAVYLASHRQPVERLILVTPFDSLTAVAARHYPFFPVRWLLLDRFNSVEYAPLVTAPTLILAAGKDEVVPNTNSQNLRSHFKAGVVSYHLLPGATHNSISEEPGYWRLLASGGA